MPRQRQPFPSYQFHKASGQAVIRVYSPHGTPIRLYIGAYDSPESRAEYARICAALRPGNVYVEEKIDPETTVAELVAVYLAHARVYYRTADGKPTSEIREVEVALKFFVERAGDLLAAAVGPKLLATVRTAMIARGWCRPLVNKRADKVKRLFKWAVAEELVPPAVYEGLRALAGLKRGRTEAREPDPIEPVPAADYERTLPHLPRLPRAICELLRLTGMRPGEACAMRWEEVERVGDVWTFRPEQHKTRHHGRRRVIPLGPRAQAVLAAWQADRPTVGRVFCAAAERERRYAEMRAKRKTKVQPSQASRKKAKPKKTPQPGYTPLALAHAVAAACRRGKVPHWHPNQLRHLVLTEVREKFGLDAAQVIGGHARADVTQVYATIEAKKGAEVAAQVG